MQRLTCLVLAMALLSGGPAAACMDPPPPDVVARLDEASHVFVARLVSLEETAPGSRDITGEIEIAYALLGEPRFRRIAFEDTWCNGLHPVVGRYFLVATAQEGEQLLLHPGDDSIIDLSRIGSTKSPPRPEPDRLLWHVARHLEGTPMPKPFENALNHYVLFSTPPPPPLPPPD